MNFAELVVLRTPPSPMQTASTVFVIDNDLGVREWLARSAGSTGWQARCFASAEEFLAEPRSLAPGCLLLDLHEPGIGGLELQARLAARRELPIIFTAGNASIPMIVCAMKAGAVDVLTKPFCDETLSSVISDALERSRTCIRHERELRRMHEGYASLSQREREVMTLVVSGLLNKQVGVRLEISEITVKVHRGRVMRKMAVDSLAHLVNVANELGITPVLPALRNSTSIEDDVPAGWRRPGSGHGRRSGHVGRLTHDALV